jgi:hypothetical protein
MTLLKTGTNTWDLQNGVSGSYSAWVPTFAGFTVNPTAISRYQVIGKTCFWRIGTTVHGTGSGTSPSGTSFTVPFTSSADGGQSGVLRTLNQSTQAVGVWSLPAGSNVCTVYRDPTLILVWTDAQNRSFSGCGQFEIA